MEAEEDPRAQALDLPGADLAVRPLTPDDRATFEAGFEALSPESRLLRFAGPKPRLSAREVTYLVDVDHRSHEALVVFERDSGKPIALGRYVRLADEPTVAEVAVTVLDAHQGRGIGPALLRVLADRAAAAGIHRLRAEVLGDNRRARSVLTKLGYRAPDVEWGGALHTVELDLRDAGRG